ncbi:MAG: AAA family ATPase [Thermodesulfobacteriota bacterium]|nr:AAA family ATPase [Thermodesulfobacteriota bacterium]
MSKPNPVKDYFGQNWLPFYEKYLQGVKALNGYEFHALCPFHDDKNPSFCFNSETGLFLCQACQKKGDPFHCYAKMNGLDTRRDFPRIIKGICNEFGIEVKAEKPRIVATYDYHDAQGSLVSQVCRKDDKSFQQRRPADGKGKWIWNMKGIQPVLFNLPQVMKAREVLVVEGEKDCQTLAGLGLVATTNPMGAGKWRPQYSEILKGKDVVLLPDFDEPGRKHMQEVARSLNGQARSIKLIELPGLPKGGDVSDFVATFQDKDTAAERLALMIEQAGPYTPKKKVTTIEDAVLPITEFSSLDLPERKAFLSPWLLEQSITLVSGWRGIGKSWFALGLLKAVATGTAFGPWQATEPARVLYLDGEMVPSDLTERLDDLGLEANGQDLPFYIYSDAYSNLLGLPRANLLSKTWRESMHRILTTRHIRLWILDNLVSTCPGIDENSQKEWSPVNDWLLSLRFKGISTVLLHHTGKSGSQRGTSGREDNIDTSILLKKPFDYTNEDGARFVAHFSKARVKTRDLPAISDTEFKLTQDEAGGLVWTFGSVKAKNRDEILRLLNEGLSQKDVAEALGVSKGTVSKTRSQAIKDEWMTPKNKLTPTGFEHVV